MIMSFKVEKLWLTIVFCDNILPVVFCDSSQEKEFYI